MINRRRILSLLPLAAVAAPMAACAPTESPRALFPSVPLRQGKFLRITSGSANFETFGDAIKERIARDQADIAIRLIEARHRDADQYDT